MNELAGILNKLEVFVKTRAPYSDDVYHVDNNNISWIKEALAGKISVAYRHIIYLIATQLHIKGLVKHNEMVSFLLRLNSEEFRYLQESLDETPSGMRNGSWRVETLIKYLSCNQDELMVMEIIE